MTTTAEDSPDRILLHTREITCKGYQRSDGLFDIEGRLQDLTNEPTDLPFHHLDHGGTIHDMRLVMTFDADMVIRHVTARTATGASPFCAGAAAAYSALTGLTIASGFKQKLKAVVGGVNGCTHMTELLERMASTAMQTIFSTYRSEATRRRAASAQREIAVRPWVIGTCHAYREDGEAVKLLWPQGLPKA